MGIQASFRAMTEAEWADVIATTGMLYGSANTLPTLLRNEKAFRDELIDRIGQVLDEPESTEARKALRGLIDGQQQNN
jgi:crotonobetainyl-CoA:carnitine CoA-transferase CaiB-like acyl-CoA transferase